MLLPDLLGLFLTAPNDGPAGVLRIARARRIFRLLRFVQILRLWRTVERFSERRKKEKKERWEIIHTNYIYILLYLFNLSICEKSL